MKTKTSRRGKKSSASNFLDAAQSLFNEVLEAPVSSAIAFAVVALAAGSVLAITSLSTPEIAMGDLGPVRGHLAKINFGEQVLGESTGQVIIDDISLEAGSPAASLSAKPLSFDSTLGRWDYRISYSVSNLSGTGSLTIGTYVVQSGITASGQAETGAILKPNMVYHVSFWGIDGNGKQNLAHIDLKTGKAKTGPDSGNLMPPLCSTLPSSTSTPPSTSISTMPKMPICIKNSAGKIQCTPRCIPFMQTGQQPQAFGDHGSATGTPEHATQSTGTPDHFPPGLPPPHQ